jgi:hypothetical protein
MSKRWNIPPWEIEKAPARSFFKFLDMQNLEDFGEKGG